MNGRRIPFHPGLRAPEGTFGPAWWLVFRRRELLVWPELSLRTVAGPDELGVEPVRTQYLGRLGDCHCYSAELPEDAEPPQGMVFRDLRALFAKLPPELHELAGRAVQIVDWDRSHQFCGACGAPTEPSESERSRVCRRCGQSAFPRLAPSIIVAVEREDEILLGRSPHFPPGIYSVLAGFVEPGESVEEAVHREVGEEAGISITDLRWFGSQPWPYPHSLMLGFQARWAGGEVRVDGVELEDAGFYRADALPRTFPGNISISQWLLHDFRRRQRD